ncbi:translation factor GUF1 homolog, mitochondrial [Rhododendron vialii]|uniref:translation factor GUF1 homolog, mitochondrial n=1 Tax=Rhododendron vialii TaxID=182163 RepID=UPI00265EF6E7|nr:translation factor GUF1 homolog, mitochondrial [Rhododendron vialii]
MLQITKVKVFDIRLGFDRKPQMGYLRRASNTISLPKLRSLSAINRVNPVESRLNWNQFGWNHHAFCSHSRQNSKDNANSIDLSQYPTERIRNFSIIAHVDHGKSTLADRLLELTGTIKRGHGQPQYLDKLQVERERGITVKAQTATMFYDHKFQGANDIDVQEPRRFLLNLIDTPGHVDFSYEVSRSLAACQGALLVVDAAQGVQAQTVANFYLAFESNLTIIPVINKIDQPTADPDRVKAQLKSMFDLDPNGALLTSAKTGQGLEHVLPAVIERMPPPPGNCNSPLRMLLLDSYYDEYKGVICHVAVVDGTLRKGDKISSAATGQSYEVLDVGIMHPELTPTGVLLTGQVGYVVSGMRSTKEARVGDTLHQSRSIVEPLPGFKPVKHMVFSGVYPVDGSDFEALNHAIERLTCNDASVSVTKESSTALGLGFRCGFLGLLHMDVFHQRLEQEYGAHVISTVPTVPYIFEYSDGSKVQVQNPAALPSNSKQRVTATWEPTVIATIIIPSEYVGPVITLCSERRGEQLEYTFIDSQRALMKYRLPLREIVVDFYNELKSITSGYASFDYEDSEYQASDLVKLDLLLNGQPIDAMTAIVHNLKAQRLGRDLVEKLKKFIDRQMFEITIQAAIGSKVVARETVSAMRKNVLAKCYGGDVTRKRKLLEKQKEGKKRMKRVGSVDIPQEAFHELLKVS